MEKINRTVYIPALDGLRFVAFLWVFVGHLPRPSSSITKFQYTNWMGVDLFFVLSSFLITVLLVTEFKNTKSISLTSFFARRCLRIFPLYLLVLVFGFFIFPFLSYDIGPISGSVEYNSLKKFFIDYVFLFANVTLPIQYLYSPGNVLAPMWSIMVEFQFYLIICPILIFIIKKDISYIKYLALALILIAISYRFYVVESKYIYTSLLGRMDSFGFGMVLAFFYIKGHIHKYSNRIGFSFLILALVILQLISKMEHPTNSDTSVFIYTYSGLCSFFLILAILASNMLSKFFSISFFSFFGKISLGLYLFHTFGIHVSQEYYVPFIKEPYSRFLLSFLIASCISILSYNFFEKYFMNLKKKFAMIERV